MVRIKIAYNTIIIQINYGQNKNEWKTLNHFFHRLKKNIIARCQYSLFKNGSLWF